MTEIEIERLNAMQAIWDNAPGLSAIFNFPFKIYASEPLGELNGENASYRYRLNFIDNHSSSGRQPIPVAVCPNFTVAPSYTGDLPRDEVMMDLSYGGIHGPFGEFTVSNSYSQIRLDVWGNNCDEEIRAFCEKYLYFVAMHTDQYWMNSYEANFNLSPVYSMFPIDELGRCLVRPNSEQKILAHGFAPLDNYLATEIFKKAISGKEVDAYWLIYFEAQSIRVRGQIDQAVLLLALSIEVARNTVFRQFVKVKKENAAGVTFEAPFDNTNLLENLSINLEKKIGRNLAKEEPRIWQELVKIYTVRHQVAHGKKAAFQVDGKMILVDHESFIGLALNTRNVLAWLLGLGESVKMQ